MPVVGTQLPSAQARKDSALFEFAPVSLWNEDFSALKNLLDQWHMAGVTDLRAWLEADTGRVEACWQKMRVLRVNRKTLSLFAAADQTDLESNTQQIFHAEMTPGYIDELMQLWETRVGFASKSVNYNLDGKRLDILVSGRILPGYEESWSQVVVAIQDITAAEEAQRRQALSESFAQALFEQSPVGLFAYDLSACKKLVDSLCGAGITDAIDYARQHPEFVMNCVRVMRVVDVNKHTLSLYGAPDKETLVRSTRALVNADTLPSFAEHLLQLIAGTPEANIETKTYTLAGEPLHLVTRLSVVAGHEHDWSLVLAAVTDITARKKVEAQLAWLSNHDVPTGLFNRSHYLREVERLTQARAFPVSVVIIDLNGLKRVNDRFGHAEGDVLLRRAAGILQIAAPPAACAARIGGDEFALLLPNVDAAAAARIIDRLCALNDEDNKAHPDRPLSLSVGLATCGAGSTLDATVREADLRMYESKRAYYAAAANRRR